MKKICFVIIALFVLASCKTIKSAETHTENRTEVNVDSTDTAKVHSDSTGVEHKTSTTEKEKTHTESHKEQRDSFVTVVDQSGNVIGTKEYHWLKESLKESSEREKLLEDSLKIYRQMSDSIGYYRSKIDSISNIKQDEKIVEVEKKQTIKQRISEFFIDAIIAIVIVGILVILVRAILRR